MNKKTTGGFNNLHAALTAIAQQGLRAHAADKASEVDYEEYYAEHQNCLKGTGSGENIDHYSDAQMLEVREAELEAAHAKIDRLKAHAADLSGQVRQLSTDVGQARTDGFRAGMREVQQFIGAWL